VLRGSQWWLSLFLALAFMLGMRIDADASQRPSEGDAIAHGLDDPDSTIRTRPSSRLVEQAAPRGEQHGALPLGVLAIELDSFARRPQPARSTHAVRLASVLSWSAQPRGPPI
jgi:hypothetical protein